MGQDLDPLGRQRETAPAPPAQYHPHPRLEGLQLARERRQPESKLFLRRGQSAAGRDPGKDPGQAHVGIAEGAHRAFLA